MQTEYAQEDGSRIEVEDTFGYFRDALRCFRAGAYRASIGEIYNAVFMDVYTKLSNFTEVNGKKKYVDIFHRAQNARNAKSPFEKNLAEELGTVGFLTEKQSEFLEELRNLRNDSSHPIGWDASEGQASYVLTEAVRLFLGESSLSPAMVREEILIGLHGANCFPSGIRSSRRKIVEQQVDRTIPAAYHLLIKEIASLRRGEHDLARRNAGVFLEEAICLANEPLRKAIVAQFVEPALDDPSAETTRLIATMARLSPKWILGLSDQAREKLVRVLFEYAKTATAREATKLVEALHQKTPYLLKGPFQMLVRSLIEVNPTSPTLPNILREPSGARAELFYQYRVRAIGRDRERFVAFLDANATMIVKHLSGVECYALLLATSGRVICGSDPMQGIAALLLPRATEWFQSAPERARKDAEKSTLYDPALWFDYQVRPEAGAEHKSIDAS